MERAATLTVMGILGGILVTLAYFDPTVFAIVSTTVGAAGIVLLWDSRSRSARSYLRYRADCAYHRTRYGR